MTIIRNTLTVLLLLAVAPLAASASSTNPTKQQAMNAYAQFAQSTKDITACGNARDVACINQSAWQSYDAARTVVYAVGVYFKGCSAQKRSVASAGGTYLADVTVAHLAPRSILMAQKVIGGLNVYTRALNDATRCASR